MQKFYLPIAVSAAAALLQGADMTVPFEKYKLKNGMKAILSQDNSVPVVAVYMLYNVGSRDEEKGRTGFAHLFEHMMFEGSANAPKGLHGKLVEGNGGTLNGSTHPDFTDYFEILPSNKLAVGLWLESDRMRSLDITPENLANQKEAVKQERRLSFDNRPYSTAIIDRWPQVAFQNWQNSHSLIGSFEDLNASSVEDVAKFFRTYYAPDNAVMVIVGDIQIPETRKLIEQYFGDIPPQPKPAKPDLSEPANPTPRSDVYHDAHARVPAVIVGYPAPVRRSRDYYALGMLDVLLTGGPSARFELNLVKGAESVIQYQAEIGWPFASSSDYKDPGDYAMFLLFKPNFTPQQIVDQAQDEIAKIQTEGVDGKELGRARTFLRSERITSLQSTLHRAQLLGRYEILDGKAELINTDLENFLAVTPADIQSVAGEYLTPERRTVMEILPAPTAANGIAGSEAQQ